MKTLLFLVLIAVLISKTTSADIILDNYHKVVKCVKITNIADYPDVSLIGYSYFNGGDYSATLLSSTECLSKGRRNNSYIVFAVNKSYLQGKDISKINYFENPNALPSNIPIEPYMGNVRDTNPISAIEEFYKILGFTESKVVLFKWKQITKYNNGKPDLVENFNFPGDVSSLSQKITGRVSAANK